MDGRGIARKNGWQVLNSAANTVTPVGGLRKVTTQGEEGS
jgi:hypothetical protein